MLGFTGSFYKKENTLNISWWLSNDQSDEEENKLDTIVEEGSEVNYSL